MHELLDTGTDLRGSCIGMQTRASGTVKATLPAENLSRAEPVGDVRLTGPVYRAGH